MIATFHCFLAVLGACILYHTEFANRAIEKLHMLPVSQGKVFFCKNLLLLLLFLPVFLIETCFLLFCARHWFPGETLGAEILLENMGFFLSTYKDVLKILFDRLICPLHSAIQLVLYRNLIKIF